MTDSMLGRAIRRVGKWTVGFAAVGVLVGLFMMFGKAPPFAESGHKPDDVMFYSFWVPIVAVLGSMAGLALGTIAAIWSAWMEWGDRRQDRVDARGSRLEGRLKSRSL